MRCAGILCIVLTLPPQVAGRRVKPSAETNALESEVAQPGDLFDVTSIIAAKERAPTAEEDGVKCCCSDRTGRCEVVKSQEQKCKKFKPQWAQGERLRHYTNGKGKRCTVSLDDVQSIYENYGGAPSGYCTGLQGIAVSVLATDLNKEAMVKCDTGYAYAARDPLGRKSPQEKRLCSYASPTSGKFLGGPTTACVWKLDFCAGSHDEAGAPLLSSFSSLSFGPAAYGGSTTVSCPVGYQSAHSTHRGLSSQGKSAPVCTEDGDFFPTPSCSPIPDFCAAVAAGPSNIFAASVEAAALGEVRMVTCPPGMPLAKWLPSLVRCSVDAHGAATFSPQSSLVCGAELTAPITVVVTVDDEGDFAKMETLLGLLSGGSWRPMESDSGLTARMTMQSGLGSTLQITEAKGQVFADTVLGLPQIFANLGMPEKFAQVEGKVATQVKRATMVLIAQQLKEQGVRATVTTEPAVAEEEEETAVAAQPDYEMFFRVVVHDRTVLAETLRPLDGAQFQVKGIAQSKFLYLIGRQLEEKVVAAVAEKVGGGLITDGLITVTTEADAGAEEAAERKSFWLKVKVSAVDVAALLEKTKGRVFADNFNHLLESLQALYLPNSDVLISDIYDTLDKNVMGGIGDVLLETLPESIGADVWRVYKRGFIEMQAVATQGRCCVGESGGEAVKYWVPNKLARGSGAFGLGYGREGHCPKIQQGTGCVAQGFSETRRAIVTSHTSYTDCFIHGGAGGTIGAPTSYIAAECSEATLGVELGRQLGM